ncbi:MAG: DUF502 domain-containing protein [Gammaproteobacteria bacterium]|nr:DUF502 domain-containing protein [Gammaproteobacteria bacterium]
MLKLKIRRYLVAGLLVWVPLAVTLAMVKFLVGILDSSLLLLPEEFQPEHWVGFYIPGLGFVLVLLVVFFTGVIVANLFGRKLVELWETILARIPLVRSIYSGAKQVAETMFSGAGKSFRKVVMVQYPREGIWTLAFVTGESWQVAEKHVGTELINIYVPTTPNPTSGFFLMVPRKDIIELDISVDEGLKMIISMGVVIPGSKKPSSSSAQSPAI